MLNSGVGGLRRAAGHGTEVGRNPSELSWIKAAFFISGGWRCDTFVRLPCMALQPVAGDAGCCCWWDVGKLHRIRASLQSRGVRSLRVRGCELPQAQSEQVAGVPDARWPGRFSGQEARVYTSCLTSAAEPAGLQASPPVRVAGSIQGSSVSGFPLSTCPKHPPSECTDPRNSQSGAEQRHLCQLWMFYLIIYQGKNRDHLIPSDAGHR